MSLAIDKIKEALKKDFCVLYQKNFSTMWREERLKICTEIDVMDFANLKFLLEAK